MTAGMNYECRTQIRKADTFSGRMSLKIAPHLPCEARQDMVTARGVPPRSSPFDPPKKLGTASS